MKVGGLENEAFRYVGNITWEDDNFIEELLEVAQLFRPFSDAITEFISEHGFDGDSADVDAKVTFIRTAFEKANMTPPREIREWFIAMQPIKRDTAFLICFAFDLDGGETDEFFRRYYAKERSFKACRAHSMLKWLQGT